MKLSVFCYYDHFTKKNCFRFQNNLYCSFPLDFPFNSRECLQLALNPILGGFDCQCCVRNSANALSPTTFAFNRCLCALRLVVKHTRGYCFVLNGFIRLVSIQAISDFTSAASLFAILKISMLRIGFVWIYQVPRLLKRILRYSATVKIILANCSYFKAKDPLCPLSFRLLTWLINWNPTKKGFGHRS